MAHRTGLPYNHAGAVQQLLVIQKSKGVFANYAFDKFVSHVSLGDRSVVSSFMHIPLLESW